MPDKIQGANKGDRLSDFAAQPPTSCRNINSSVSLWLRIGKTPCVLVLCRGHVVIGGCVHAASRTEKQAKLDLYDAATWILCISPWYFRRVIFFTHLLFCDCADTPSGWKWPWNKCAHFFSKYPFFRSLLVERMALFSAQARLQVFLGWAPWQMTRWCAPPHDATHRKSALL